MEASKQFTVIIDMNHKPKTFRAQFFKLSQADVSYGSEETHWYVGHQDLLGVQVSKKGRL